MENDGIVAQSFLRGPVLASDKFYYTFDYNDWCLHYQLLQITNALPTPLNAAVLDGVISLELP